MTKAPGRWLFIALYAAFMGGCVTGGGVGCSQTGFDKGPTIYARLPHHVAPSADSPAFKFAMVHDVIHERYPRHGAAFYEERERLAREKMASFHPDSETAFALTDDIAVGLDRRGRTDEAIALMRDKLKRQQALDLKESELYTSYANLAEFLLARQHVGDDDGRRKGTRTGQGRTRVGAQLAQGESQGALWTRGMANRSDRCVSCGELSACRCCKQAI